MIKWYLVGLSVVIALIALFGFLLPALISARSNEAVLIGFAIIFSLPVCFYPLGKMLSRTFKKEKE